MFLLDANIFITAKHLYYPMDRVPEYWEWLLYKAEKGEIKVPIQIYEELQEQDDELCVWIKNNKEAFILSEDNLDVGVPEVLACYGDDLMDHEVEQIGADPFLIAAAIAMGGTVVSKEVSKPSRTGARRRVPDVCSDVGVRCIDDHMLIKELNFTTSWRLAPA